MTTGNEGFGQQLAQKSRLRNPLNVVVEKVGATRAMVHGDVSVESLKELLMSSLSLLPSTKTRKKDVEGTRGSGGPDSKTELYDEEEEENRKGRDPSSKLIGKEKRTISGTAMSDGKKDKKMKGMKVAGIDDPSKASGGGFFSAKKTEDKLMKSMKNIGEGRSRAFGKKFGTKSKSEGFDHNEEEGEGENEDEEDPEESLPSCSSVLSIGKLPFSNDGHWLRRHFETPLVQGLKDVVTKKPQDPVRYLAFWLREYRSQEEARKRKTDFDDELNTKRLLIASHVTNGEESAENLESGYHEDGEEGGGIADWNFKNYYPGSENTEFAAEVTV